MPRVWLPVHGMHGRIFHEHQLHQVRWGEQQIGIVVFVFHPVSQWINVLSDKFCHDRRSEQIARGRNKKWIKQIGSTHTHTHTHTHMRILTPNNSFSSYVSQFTYFLYCRLFRKKLSYANCTMLSCAYIHVGVCLHFFLYACMHACMCVCVHACMRACVRVHVYVWCASGFECVMRACVCVCGGD